MSRTLCFLACAWMLCLIGLVSACGGPSKEGVEGKDKESYDGELILPPQALERFVQVYFATKSKGQDGWMTVHDDVTNADLKLKLGKVRAVDPAPETSPGHFYVCSDMTDDKGATYDVDFVYKKTGRGIEVSDVLIHKSPDKTRYDWVQDERKRFWVRQPQS